MDLKLDMLVSSGLSGLGWEAAALALSRESLIEGELIKGAHERALSGFLCYLSSEVLLCVCFWPKMSLLLQ